MYIRMKERQESQRKRQERKRKERQNRDAFRALLNEKAASRELNFKTKWADFAKSIKDDDRYYNLLG